MATAPRPKPVVLCILDGWGYREATDHNAVALAKGANWARLMQECPWSLVDASELHVGLPHGQMGNSEVGHMNLGAGRVVMQDLPRIDLAIEDGSLARLTFTVALPSASASGRSSSGVRSLLAVSSSATPN